VPVGAGAGELAAVGRERPSVCWNASTSSLQVLHARCVPRAIYSPSAQRRRESAAAFIVTRRIGLATDAGCGVMVSGASSACCLWSAARRTVGHSAAGR
jgi:hypothetical protein